MQKVIYSSPFKNILTLDLWSDGDFRDDSRLPFPLNLCKTPGNCLPAAFSRVAKGWRVMLESQDFQAEQWVVLEVTFPFTCQVLFDKLPLYCLRRWTKVKQQSRSLAVSFPLFPFHVLVLIFKSMLVRSGTCLMTKLLQYGWHCACSWLSVSFQSPLNFLSLKKNVWGNNSYLFPRRKHITLFLFM